GDVLEYHNHRLPRFWWFNDRLDATAPPAVTNVGLLFVILFHFFAEFVELFVRRLFVATIAGPRENGKNCVRGLGRAHHGVARSRPRHNESRVVSLAAKRVVARAERTAHHYRDFRHD